MPQLLSQTSNPPEISGFRFLRRSSVRTGVPASGGPGDGAARSPAYSGNSNGTSPFKHILVVDDDPDCRDLVARTLSRAGFRPETARDGEEGWGALCSATYDLVITDHEMPRLTGLNLIKRLRAVSIEPPCILLSGNLPGPESTLRELVRPGSILAKPFSGIALIEEVFGLLLRGEF
jgi:CheY-like chemotaxis protein